MPMIQERLAFCAMMIARPLSNFGGGGAVGESTFVGPVSGALPFSNPDNAKWTAGKSSSAAGDATKDHKQYTQHPPVYLPRKMLSQVVSRPITTRRLLRDA
jgi:hypothetical protein